MGKPHGVILGAGLLLVFALPPQMKAQAQSPAPAGSQGANGQVSLMPDQGADLISRYKNDPLMLHSLHEQVRLARESRQKQLLEATDRLLKMAESLRTEMVANPGAIPTAAETETLDKIKKLAHWIQSQEKAQDEVSSELARQGIWP